MDNVIAYISLVTMLIVGIYFYIGALLLFYHFFIGEKLRDFKNTTCNTYQTRNLSFVDSLMDFAKSCFVIFPKEFVYWTFLWPWAFASNWSNMREDMKFFVTYVIIKWSVVTHKLRKG